MEKLFELIDKIEIAMFTTRRADGHLVSRPMATQKRAEGADLWFVTDKRSEKLVEIGADPHVNLGYYKDRTKEWVRPRADRGGPRQNPRALHAGLAGLVRR